MTPVISSPTHDWVCSIGAFPALGSNTESTKIDTFGLCVFIVSSWRVQNSRCVRMKHGSGSENLILCFVLR
ncbi:hypothetical protein MHYP_G00164340 [Metynnis hypsauchen]